jgi:hypothetical protein
MDERGSQLDLSSDAAGKPSAGGRTGPGEDDRGKFLGVQFECCGVYSRVYKNRAGDAYEGRCPRCMKRVSVGIGPDGGSARFFTAR